MGAKDRGVIGYGLVKNRVILSTRMHVFTILAVALLHIVLASMFAHWRLEDDMRGTCGLLRSAPNFWVFWGYMERFWGAFFARFWMLSPVWILYPLGLWAYRKEAANRLARTHVRGAKMTTPEALAEGLRRDKIETDLSIGEVSFPRSAETQHALVIGRPGVGKTVLLSGVLQRLRERGDRGVIHDFKGDYVERFYDPTRDLLFNPVDSRCLAWQLMDEIETATDVDGVAASLVPPAAASDPFFNPAARDVLAGLLNHVYQSGARTNADIWKALMLPGREMSETLRKTPGGEGGWRVLEDGNNPQARGVVGTLMIYAKSFALLARIADRGFKIRDWLESGKGWIFVTNYSEISDTLRPLLSLFLDLLGRKLLGMSDDRDRRVFFMLDEFGTLQRLSSILRLLTLSRSKGGSVWLGIQDVGQIQKTYGREHSASIINACGTSAIFAVSDPETAEYLSKRLGQEEIEEADENLSMGVETLRDGFSITRRRKIESLVLPSEVIGLPKLELYVRIPDRDVCRTKLVPVDRPQIAPALVFRPDLRLSSGNRTEAGEKAGPQIEPPSAADDGDFSL